VQNNSSGWGILDNSWDTYAIVERLNNLDDFCIKPHEFSPRRKGIAPWWEDFRRGRKVLSVTYMFSPWWKGSRHGGNIIAMAERIASWKKGLHLGEKYYG
jgi:hypothetical protein